MKFFDSANVALHSDLEQLKRQKSALSLNMTSVDSILHTDTIKNYFVSLENCSCVDFSRRKKPCKHMYRLAMDLGIFKINEKNFKNAEFKPKKTFDVRTINYEYSRYEDSPKNFVVIDFETANQHFNSVCQMGIVTVENNLIAEEKNFLIKPPYKKFTNTEIHGITFDDVKFVPTFDKLWSSIKGYIDGHIIAAYNLFFDWNCLDATLEHYQIEKPKFQAFDILVNVKNFYSGEYPKPKSYSLINIAKLFELHHKAHDALSDSQVAAKIQIRINEKSPAMPINLYVADVSTMLKIIASDNLSEYQMVDYCNYLLTKNISYDHYKEVFQLIEQIAAQKKSALMYKCCGSFYEQFNKISRAIFLYKKSLELDSKIKLKSKIQKLEKAVKNF